MSVSYTENVETVRNYNLIKFANQIDRLEAPDYSKQCLLVLRLSNKESIRRRVISRGASTAQSVEILDDLPGQGCLLLFTCNYRSGFQFRKFVLQVNPESENEYIKRSQSFMQDIRGSFKPADSFCILYISEKFTEFATLRQDVYKKSEKRASFHKSNYVKKIRRHLIGQDRKYIIISEKNCDNTRREVMKLHHVAGNVVHDKGLATGEVTSIDQLVSSIHLHGVPNSSVHDFMFLGNMEKPDEDLKALYGPTNVVNAILDGVVHSLAIWSGVDHVIHDVTSTDGTVRGHVLMDHVHVGPQFVELVTGNRFNRTEDHNLIDWVIQKLSTAEGRVRIVTSNLLREHQFVTEHSGIGALVYKESFLHPLLIEVEQ